MISTTFSAQIDAAIAAHAAWKERLLDAIKNGGSDIDARAVGNDNACTLGLWLHCEDIPEREKKGEYYGKVRTWHAAFHKEADKVMKLIERGQKQQALAALEDIGSAFNQVSYVLTKTLKEWKAHS